MASMLLVSAASAEPIGPLGSTGMTFQGQVVLGGNLSDPADRTVDGTLTLIVDCTVTLVIATNSPGDTPEWTMLEDASKIGEGTMDDFGVVSEGSPTFPPFGRSGVMFTARYNGTGYVDFDPFEFDFSEVGTSTGDALLGLDILTWTGTTVFGEEIIITPEPATMSLLGIGAVAMLRRKRQK
jgi:hypothetical protein